MKKIKKTHSNKDRIICVSESDKHKFYYQPVKTKERIWLFDTKKFSGSVFAFFSKYGRCIEGVGFSLTLNEIYAKGYNHNVKIAKVLDRIPSMVEYVIGQNEEEIKMVKAKKYYTKYNNDYERIA
mgnify:CR=1 FL=1